MYRYNYVTITNHSVLGTKWFDVFYFPFSFRRNVLTNRFALRIFDIISTTATFFFFLRKRLVREVFFLFYYVSAFVNDVNV